MTRLECVLTRVESVSARVGVSSRVEYVMTPLECVTARAGVSSRLECDMTRMCLYYSRIPLEPVFPVDLNVI